MWTLVGSICMLCALIMVIGIVKLTKEEFEKTLNERDWTWLMSGSSVTVALIFIGSICLFN